MIYSFPKDTKGLVTIIEDAITSAKTLREKVQLAAVSILKHAEAHGDYSFANVLVEGLGHGVKRDSLVAFFVKYGGLSVSDDKQGFDGWLGKEHIRTNFQEAKATMWYDIKKANPYVGYDLNDVLRKLVDSASKKKAKFNERLEACTDDVEKIKMLESNNFNVQDELVSQLLTLCNIEVDIIEDDTKAA